MSNNKLAIFLIIISVFFGTLMLTFLKLAQAEVNVYVAGFFRFLFGFLRRQVTERPWLPQRPGFQAPR